MGGLRAVLREALDHYAAAVDGGLGGVLALLEGGTVGSQAPRVPPARDSQEALALLRGLKLKPEKGRVKDLARIEKAARELAALVDGGSA